MNPQYIYAIGTTFYYLTMEAVLREAVSELAELSYEACHMDAFGHVSGQPCRAGASYSKHFAVNGLYKLA